MSDLIFKLWDFFFSLLNTTLLNHPSVFFFVALFRIQSEILNDK